jgi:hypothetical protein
MDLVDNPYVSAFTKKTLGQFGWADGDPIPAELGEKLLSLKETLPASSRTDVLIDIGVMSEQDIKTVKDSLSAAKAHAARTAAAETLAQITENMTDSVRDTYNKLFGADAPQIVDDRDAPAAEQAEEEKRAEPQQTEDATPPEEDATPPATGLGPMVIPPFCPRCGWDMLQKFDVEVTDSDKVDFLATLLGAARFRREYELAGGKMILRLRSLLADENFLVQRQLLLDQEAGEILSANEWYLRMAEYRMACSLDAIIDKNGKVIVANPELSDLQFTPPADKPTQTVLVLARQQVNRNALAHEVTRRLVAAHLRKFQRLVEAMEAMALEPSFWNGIE